MIRRLRALLLAPMFLALAGILALESARADFTFTQGSGPTAFSFTSTTGGTALCAAANTHCFANVPVDTAGAQLFANGNAGFVRFPSAQTVTGAGGTFPVTGASGSFASGSIASGAMVDLGAIADAASTAGGTGSVNAKLRLMTTQLGTLNTTLGTPFQAGGSIGNTTFAVTQATAASLNATVVGTGTFATQAAQTGTWTVQPGNTANTTAWLVTGTGGTFPATQAGTWNVTNISGTVSLPTGASTAANQTSVIGTKNAGTAATNSMLAGAVFNSTPLTVTDGQGASLQSDANGFLKVNVAAGGASGGTSSSFAASFPATGTAAGMSQGGNMVALTGTSGNLNVQCANCSGSGASAVDEAAFTAGTSVFAPAGGFFQTTATNNALTNGQQGAWQMTATRAGFVNLRNAAGTEVGTSGAPVRTDPTGTTPQPATQSGTWTVQPGNTANSTAWLVTGTGGTFPATQSGTWNVATVTTVTTLSTLTGGGIASGATDSGNPVKIGGKYNSTPITLTDGQRGDLQLDASGFVKVNVAAPVVGLAQGSPTSGQTGSIIMGAVTTAAPTYTTAQTSPVSLTTGGDMRVLFSNTTIAATQSGTWTVQPGNTANTTAWLVTGTGGTFPATQSGTWNITNISGTVSLPTGASTATNQTSVIGTKNAGTAATNSLLAAAVFNSTPLTVTDGQQASLQSDANGFLKVNIAAGSAAGGTSSAFGSAFPANGTAAGYTDGTNMVAARVGDVNNVAAATNYLDALAVARYNATQPTLTDTRFNALQVSQRGELLVAPGTTGFTVTAAQSTAANLNATVVGTGTFAVQAAATLAAETTKVIGTVRNVGNVGGVFDAATAAAVPANALYMGVNVGGNLTGLAPGAAGTASTQVFTIQGIASMTKLLVTPDSVALPANQSVNVSQINAVTPLMGNGATGTGSQRVTVVNDNTGIANWGQGATGSTVPTGAQYVGYNLTGNLASPRICQSTAKYDASTSGSTELVALTSGQTIRICGFLLSTGATATNVKLVYGTGTNCGTGSTDITPAFQLSTNDRAGLLSPFWQGLATASANALCINASAGNAVQGIVLYDKGA